MILVTLSSQELITAGTVGLRRHVAALSKDRRPAHGAPANNGEDAFDHHIFGACAEFAVAKNYNLFWAPSVGLIDKCDVGGIIEVRSRRLHGTGIDLAIRPGDSDEKPYLLVHGDIPRFHLIGWLFGREGKNAGVWNEKRRLWFHEPKSLRTPPELDSVIAGIAQRESATLPKLRSTDRARLPAPT